jgi:D-alanine transaminase
MACVYLNGEYLPPEQACVPVLDRGFLIGDGVYEVIPAYGGHLLRLGQHLQRLDNSLNGIRLDNPHSPDEWRDILENIVARNEGTDQSIYLQVTRGVSARDHAFPPGDVQPTVFVMSNPLSTPEPALLQNGIAAILVEDIRWRFCHIKAIALLPNILLRQQARDVEAFEAILQRDGKITEGAASNVFIVRDGTIMTPPSGECLLPGITRDLVLELAAQHGLSHAEADIDIDMLKCADEIWLTSSTKEILPVTSLDGQPVGNGRPGPLWRQMLDYYQAYKQALRTGEAS